MRHGSGTLNKVSGDADIRRRSGSSSSASGGGIMFTVYAVVLVVTEGQELLSPITRQPMQPFVVPSVAFKKVIQGYIDSRKNRKQPSS